MRFLFALFLATPFGLSPDREVGAKGYDYIGVPVHTTPLDSRYQRVERYLESRRHLSHQILKGSRRSDLADHRRVLEKYVKMAGRFKYIPDEKGGANTALAHPSYSNKTDRSSRDYWQLPEETETRGAGDCEDRAIWLYARLIQMGFENVRLVVGKYRIDQTTLHAWLAYYFAGKIYILDPTINDGLWQARHYPRGFYNPVYSFFRSNRWRHRDGYHQLLSNALKNRTNR